MYKLYYMFASHCSVYATLQQVTDLYVTLARRPLGQAGTFTFDSEITIGQKLTKILCTARVSPSYYVCFLKRSKTI